MKIEQIYTECLAQGAYYIESEGEVAIIDPLREVQPYLDKAKAEGAAIKYIFETHFHADFVSGHIDLANKTGAKIIYGPTEMKTGFECEIAKDGQRYKLGNHSIEVIHTPGHTLESACLLLRNEDEKPIAIFSGDTLFIGDVGRPDLAQHVVSELTEEKLAGLLYDSLRNKIMPLPDDILVYPAHGAGSACGKMMSAESFDTLGNQKRKNYALNPALSKEEFIAELLNGLTPPPYYFPKNVLLNINGYESIDSVISQGLTTLSPEEFEKTAMLNKALIIDTRNAALFGNGHIPNSINIAIEGSFAIWVGTLVRDLNQAILIVAEKGTEEEVITRLARVGYDNALGYLEGGIEAWMKAGKKIDSVFSITADQMSEELIENPNLEILDVRKKSEFDSEHLINARNMPLDYIQSQFSEIDSNKTYFVYCAGGYRSMIFISILKAKGYHRFINVKGGFKELKQSNLFKISEYVCPSTLL